jgi:predicted small secreted protein
VNFRLTHQLLFSILVTSIAGNLFAADAAKPSPAVAKVLGYLKDHPGKHKLQNPEQELVTELEEPDRGRAHVRLYQVHDGVRVRGTLISAWVSSTGVVELARADTRELHIKTTVPAISRERAYSIALNDLKPAGGAELETSATYLEIIPMGLNGMTSDTLVWNVGITVDSEAEAAVWAYTITATDGNIIDHRKVMPASIKAASQAAVPTYDIVLTVLNSPFWKQAGVYTLNAGSHKAPYTLQDPCYGVNEPLPNCYSNPFTGRIGNTPRNGTGRRLNNIQRAPVFATANTYFDSIMWHSFAVYYGNGQLDNSDAATAGADVFFGMQRVSSRLYALFDRKGGVTGTDQRLDCSCICHI